MDKNLRARIFSIMFAVMIIGLLAFLIFMVFWLQGEATSCLKDPVQYLAEKSGESCYTYCIDQN